MEWIASPESWIALLTLTLLEIILGVDNIVMINILADRLPEAQRSRARKVGLALAMVTRIGLLFSLAWLIGLTEPLLELMGEELSARDLILLAGGLFLLVKATKEIHSDVEGEGVGERAPAGWSSTMAGVLTQIAILDLVFSLDSVITAVGMADEVIVMAIAIVIAVLVMIALINPIGRFIREHPTVKILALSFLLLIGVSLVAEAFGQEMPKGYIYFAFGFSGLVEALNLRMRKQRRDLESGLSGAGGGD